MQKSNLASNDNTEKEEVSIKLRHYEFKKRLGEGGFGQVHEAWDSKLCRPVAIKQLKAIEGAASATPTSSLLKEARLAASLKHPAFVKIFAIEDEDSSHSIVMELVPGLTLKQLLQQHPQQPLPEQQAINIVNQVAEAMQEAHASGLIHGDLKPSNLMVEPDGKVRILDFGLASQTDAQATTSMSQLDPQGTIAYMAPERMMGSPASAQSDIYALGVILYETLTGQRPFANASGLALAAALMQSNSDTWEFPAGCKPELIKLVLAMTARQTEKRLNSMQQVHEQLRGLVSVPVLAAVTSVGNADGNSGNGWKTLSKPKRFAIASAIIVALGYGAWQAAPYLEMDKMSLKPFSESLAMKQGLEALRQFERPGNYEVAAKSFEAILKRNPENAAAVAGLSIMYIMLYESDKQDEVLLQKANASAQQALKLNDKLALSHIAVARVDLQAGKYEKSLHAFEKALTFDPDNIFASYGRVTSLRKMKQYEEAIKQATAGLEKFPQERMFAEELGVSYFEQGKYSEAEKFFRLSIKIQPDSIFAYANLNNALVKQNRDNEGLQVLQQGLLVKPSALLYSNVGMVLFKKGDYVGAADAFELAVTPNKGNPAKYLGWANLGDSLLWIPGRESEAKKAYEKARELLAPRLQTSPNDSALVSRYGLYSARMGDKEKANEYIQHALKLAPKDANVHFRAGLTYELLGQRDEAIAEIAKAIENGYSLKAIESEPDLLSLRRDPRYPKISNGQSK
ncbi:serine/threonine-protein kinase [Undibacterium sp.]|uniref:serine/threonine-protein kinase n=1 Tax=Undibacterium sp. TaxID=1914977 RepID=UPI00272FF444|nr:serine/threonine-protein kinase [Undibacterium sp.]MDP1976070.1 protein kinase [Undibacterium sp.]